MKYLALIAILIAPTLLAAHDSTSSADSAPAVTTSRHGTDIARFPCLLDGSDNPLCNYIPKRRFKNPKTADSSSLSGLTRNGVWFGKYSGMFEGGFNDRTRRMQHCLKAKPFHPPQPYRYMSFKSWKQTVWLSGEPPFLAADQQTTKIRQHSYLTYLYCVSHGGLGSN